MNPHRELYNSHWTPKLAEVIAESPPTDQLVSQVLADDWDGGSDLAAGKPVSGEMLFDHVGLRGPPGRLHGGLHCLIRTITILRRIPRDAGVELFPCAINVGLGAALPLGKSVPFEARFHKTRSGESGEGWWFTSRFKETDRLQAAAWSITEDEILAPEALARWKKRYERAHKSEQMKVLRTVGLPYYGTDDLCWCASNKPASEGGESYDVMRRFVAHEGFYGTSLICAYLDNAGALTRAAYDTMTPHFTTRVSLKIAQPYIPLSERLLFLGDRAGRVPAKFSRARPITLAGREEGTETSEVLMVSDDFSKVYAHGWVDTHPIDIKRLAAELPHE